MFDKSQLRSIFQAQFNPQTWAALMQDFFNADTKAKPQQLELDNSDDVGYYLGSLTTTEGLELGFFHFQLKSGNVIRKRVGLRNLVKPFLKYEVDAAIAVFSDLEHWRLSFISDFGKNATAPKRFTYVFGDATQYYNTPVNRLVNLQGKDLSLKALHEAFSVEALSDEFFDSYKDLYEDLCDFVYTHKADANYFGAEFSTWPDKEIRDYVKKLMGRLVFLQFLQKKKWLGNSSNYLRSLFKQSDEQDDFLDKVLEPLFFGVLNTQPADRHALFQQEGWNPNLLTEWKNVPFLSGGLFEQDKLDMPTSKFPASYFEKVFDFFASYNFTIDENDPNDAEIGVDPEMLGKIFENLLEDNKDKGAYYTPKEIVNYMSSESVIQYLKTHTDESLHADIEELVKHNELQGSLREMKNAKQIGQLLKEVKVCDPAIGSGAFPMGVLNVIFNCRRTLLEGMTSEHFDDYVRVKKEIIQNNIYGVDIEQGAVDIARLRFWLALLVEAKEPEALPNLSYKIMRGNSLIATFDNQFINLDENQSHKKINEIKAKKQQLKNLQSDYYSLVGNAKLEKEVEIKKTILDIIALQIGTEILIWQQKQAAEGTLTGFESYAELKAKLPIEKQQVMTKGAAIRQRLEDQSISLQDRASTSLDFFDWHIMFADVFETKGGFDIVIGNPPYGAKLTNEEKDIMKNTFVTAKTVKGVQKGSLDSYTLFIEKAYNLLSLSGNLGYIVPISVTSSDSLSGVHNLLLSNCKEIKVSSYAVRPEPVFKNAVINTSIIMFTKTQTGCSKLLSTKMYRRKGDQFSLQNLVSNLQFVDVLNNRLFGRIPKVSSEIEISILNKLAQFAKLKSFLRKTGSPIVYRFAGGRYFKVVTNYSVGSSAERVIYFDSQYANPIGCLLSSNLSFWFYQIFSDNLNWKSSEIESFPIPNLTTSDCLFLSKLYEEYLSDIELHANTRVSEKESAYNVSSFKEYKIVRSKAIIDRIDDYIGPLYGLTQEEINFVKTYELEFRMAGE